MTNEEILKSWRGPVRNAIIATFMRYSDEPKRILTESDLKCNLYLDLIRQNPYVKYAVHTEVTHYTGAVTEKERRVYLFRDISLMRPDLIIENDELWVNHLPLAKGFRHVGPAIHFELKVKRQGLNSKEKGEISTEDIDGISLLPIRGDKEKRLAIVWLSRSPSYKVADMLKVVHASLKNLMEPFRTLTDIYLMDREQCVELIYTDKWITQKIA